MTFLLVDQSPSTVFFEGIGCLICWYIYSSTVTWYRLRHIPGPFVASFSYLWIASVTRSGRQYEIYRDLRKKYDVSLVRVGPNDLTTDDPDIIRRVSSAKGDYRKGQAYTGNRFNPYIQTMFTILDPVEHDKAKAKVAAAYSGRETPALESDVDEQLRNMGKQIPRVLVAFLAFL